MDNPPPKTLVLNYVSREFSPTRARRIAGWGTMMLCVVPVLLGVWFFVPLISHFIEVVELFGLWSALSVWSIRNGMRGGYEVIGVVLLFCGLVQFVFGVLVLRGKAWVCDLCALVTWLYLALAVLASAALLSFSILDTLNHKVYWRGVATNAGFGLLLAFLALLLCDLIAYQRWVVKNLNAEMPKRKFVGD